MKYGSQQNQTRPTKLSHKMPIGFAISAIVLVVGVVTALSIQSGRTPGAKIEERKPQVANQSHRNYVTSNAVGQTVVVDRQTGQSRLLTPEEARRLAEGIKQLINQSDEGLVAVHRADGSVYVDLQGRFQNVMLAKKEADGTISQTCTDNLESAAAFFEIDPALLGIAAPVSTSKPNVPKVEDR